ncbi:MAG TPA: endopeptidase La [candidate division Zixibacteria bacterium]|nr:endopeptidase La [candidate division Zixibacteria bacterium]
MKITRNNTEIEIHTTLPALPLRDVVIFPYTIYPLLIGRQFTINALQEAMMLEKQVFLCAQRRPELDRPEADDLYQVGVIARVLQVMKLPNGALKALVEGLVRARIVRFGENKQHFSVTVEPLLSEPENDRRLEALSRSVTDSFAEYVRLNRRIPEEVIASTEGIEDLDQLSDAIAAQMLVRLDARQKILECVNLGERMRELARLLSSEIEILKLERKIDSSVRESLSQSQREHYLQQQLKAIREELGQFDDPSADIDELYEKLDDLQAPDEVKERAEEEVRRLSRMHPYSAEAAVARSYLEWIFSLPWSVVTDDRKDFDEVERLLDADHHGLEKPKRRILEHLAVLKMSRSVRGPILCFVGPPGVGKTSLGKSIAHALDRKFIRASLGGVHDEAEIRGHRRTYIGSLPGRIVQGMKKAGSRNPVFLLDEIDKLGSDFRGDPSSALLEALDPEQNKTFSDNYLELDFDLSQTLFITTANSIAGIPRPLLDRMEVIRLPGYSESEKLSIVRNFLMPKLTAEMGLEAVMIEISDETLRYMLRHYTREAGVRDAERRLGALLRRVATKLARQKSARKRIFAFTEKELRKILGPERFIGTEVKENPTPGYAVGLAWTEMGGETLPVEVTVMPGVGKLTLTGKLGEVMKESATAGLSYIRSRARQFGLDQEFLKKLDIHVHVPEGAVPKDGPSAGITIVAGLLSALTDVPTRPFVAMTGEITLTGDVLQIGGLNEKLLAAKRAGITTVVLPEKNRKDMAEIKPEVSEGLTLRFVRTLDQALRHIFPRPVRARRLTRRRGSGATQQRLN